MKNRMRGALLGLAVGDALGAAIEFKEPDSFEPVSGYRGDGPHGLQAGEWTDDTSMALAMADSINTAGWCPDDQAEKYLLWREEGEYSVNDRCFDIGKTTQTGLLEFRLTTEALTSGSTDPADGGNGSIMRLAPAVIHATRYFPDDIPPVGSDRRGVQPADPRQSPVRFGLPVHGLGHGRVDSWPGTGRGVGGGLAAAGRIAADSRLEPPN